MKDWPMHELRRRHTLALVDHILTNEGRATTGAVGILRSLSAMAEDAITDEVCDLTPSRASAFELTIQGRRRSPVQSASSPSRKCTASRKQRAATRQWSASSRLRSKAGGGAAAAPRRLRRRDAPSSPHRPRGPDSRGHQDRPRRARRRPHRSGAGDSRPDARSSDPVNGEDCELLFTTPRGRLWRERTFYRDLWKPAQEVSGLDIRPHECRHSYVTHLRAKGVNDANLAKIVGHRLETMLARYTHSTGGSFRDICAVIG
jgi:integrase